MTLILGIRCHDGIVMAADGAATLGSLSEVTAQQRTIKKLTVHNKADVVIGTAGPVGLGQRVRATLEEGFANSSYTGRVETVAGQMRGLMIRIVQPEMQAVRELRGSAPEVAGRADACMHTLIAFPYNETAQLIQFDPACSPTIANDELPFVSLGIGQGIADHFLAFIRRVLWKDSVPTLALGVFSALWTLRHVILTNAFGIQDPIQIVTLSRETGKFEARELSKEELTDHASSVDSAEETICRWGSEFSLTPAAAAATPPPL
jgi:20S proteasome alpha/beta subunit